MISVVLPVRNGLPWLDGQLQALADQHCPEEWELVIADNGSTDGSVELTEKWAERCLAIRPIDASARRGPAAARNVGVQAATGDRLAFCDADDVVYPGWLAGCIRALARSDSAGGYFDFSSLNGRPAAPPIPAATTQLGFLPAGLAANLAVRRDVFEDLGGFAEELLVGEDIDFCWRLQLRGYRFVTAPDAVVAKRGPADFRQMFHRAVDYGRSGAVLYRRHKAAGARRDLRGAAKSWAWVLASAPRLTRSDSRIAWARTAGTRVGRLSGSVRERVFFP